MNRSFQRKVTYLALIAALLVPLAYVSRPATTGSDSQSGSAGGKLAQLREEYKLGQAQLGRIDPTSSALRYVSLGMHGLASCILWNKADEYQKQEDWISLSAVLGQLTYLQPYYVRVWTYQSWNVAYNISSQWDDYRDKYFWITRGFKLLHQGMEFNELEPQLPYEMGWMIGHKIGQADEKKDYRRLFARDDEFHRLPWTRWIEERDNWLFGKRFLVLGQEMVDNRGAVLRSIGTEMFNLQPAIQQSLYGQAKEQEGTFGDVARQAWKQAHADWVKFGEREFPSDYGFSIRYNDLDSLKQRLEEAEAKLNPLVDGVRETIRAERRAAMTPEALRAFDASPDSRTAPEQRAAAQVEAALIVSDVDAAERAEPAKRDEARRLAAETTLLRERVNATTRSRQTFNYDYWLARSEMEATDEALAARELFYRGLNEADDKPWAARKTFEEGFALWRKILDRYPVMIDDQTSYDVYDMIKAYRRVLNQLDVPFDKAKFTLRDLLEKYEQTME
jgi:hypothetical protein